MLCSIPVPTVLLPKKHSAQLTHFPYRRHSCLGMCTRSVVTDISAWDVHQVRGDSIRW